MSDEEYGHSLADQAAAWVPPWQRPAPQEPAPAAAPAPAADRGSEEPSEGFSSSTISTVAESEPQPASDRGAGRPLEGPHGTKIPEQSGGSGSGGAKEGVASGTVPGGAGTEAAGAGESVAADEATSGVPGKRGRRRATVAPEPAPTLDDTELRGALEAILLVVDQPVSELTLAQVLEQPPERIGPMLEDIAAGYTAAGHGFELRRAAGGWRLYTRPEYATYVERFVLDGQSARLTQAALETLAVVAYKQPVTRSRISAIRGVNCDGVLRTLVSRGLVEECGTEPDSGAFRYRTTTLFLEKLGLNSVDDLPPLAPFLPDDVEELADATR
ncbi:SMC-Scp complex subunit ScpB [Micromonospora sp. NPDC006766]|uniref:SMC-Scp complex subunit ScpB n=1 Tax=Micromonospora sp. NPDC006766 TaxID=3154778 RepID=UPI00340AB0CD